VPFTARTDQGVIESFRGGREVRRALKLQGRVERIDGKHIMVNGRLHCGRTGPVVPVGAQEKVVFNLLSERARRSAGICRQFPALTRDIVYPPVSEGRGGVIENYRKGFRASRRFVQESSGEVLPPGLPSIEQALIPWALGDSKIMLIGSTPPSVNVVLWSSIFF